MKDEKPKLMPCADCGKEVSKSAMSYLNCGRKLKQSAISIAAGIFIILFVTAIPVNVTAQQWTSSMPLASPAPQCVLITGGARNEVWLTVDRGNSKEGAYDPAFTFAICNFKPQVHQLKNGMWEITFSSEIAEGR